MSNTPADKLRDGAITATIWENTHDNKTFYSVDLVRSYKDPKSDEWKETNSFSGAELLRVGNLTQRAYNRITELRALASQSAPQPAAQDAATGQEEHADEIPF